MLDMHACCLLSYFVSSVLQINVFFLVAALYKLYQVRKSKLFKAKKYEGKKAERTLMK